MYQTVISRIMGKQCVDGSGRTLERIGNMPVRESDVVWTDGVVVYGNEYFSGGEVPMSGGGGSGGIPVGFGKEFYILSERDGKIKKRLPVIGNAEIVGFVNDGTHAYAALTEDGGTAIDWYDVMAGTLVYRTDERAADAQVDGDGTLLTLELGDPAGYGSKADIGLYSDGTLDIRLPTAREVAQEGLAMLLGEAGSASGSAGIQGHSGRITKGGDFYTTLANFSGRAAYKGPEIRLAKGAAVRMAATMNASGRAYTKNGSLVWAQYSANIQNPTVEAVEYKFPCGTVEDTVTDVLQGVGAVAQWQDPYLARSAPILILITGGDKFTTAFPFPKEMYASEEQYWDAWGRCVLMADGSEFIKVKGDELLSGYVRPGGAYFYYMNTTANDTYTYRDHFPLNDSFAADWDGSAWIISDNGNEVYRSSVSCRQAGLHKLRDGGYLLQDGSRADKIDGQASGKGFVCGSRNYRFCPAEDAEGMYLRLMNIIHEQYGEESRQENPEENPEEVP